MKLKYSTIIDINVALSEFDSRERPVLNERREVVTTERHVPFKIGWIVVLAIAQTRSAFKDHLNNYDLARAKIIADLNQDKNEEMTERHPKYREFFAEVTKLLNTEVECDLYKVNLADLKTDENSYPPSMIMRLLPWIRMDKPKPEKP